MLATPELIASVSQRDRLAEVLPRYGQSIPLYRDSERWAACRQAHTSREWQSLPLITKQDIRRGFPENFLGPGQNLDDLLDRELVELEHTSGTSQERTPLLLPRGWWAEQELRALRLNSMAAELFNAQTNPRRVTISSPVCSGDICYTGVPTRSERTLGSALHLSMSRFPFLWSEAELDRMAAEAKEWQPCFLDLDPVYGVVFALHCERRGIRLPSLRFVLCSYEFLSFLHRRILQRVFGVPVFNLYGSTETGHLLMEDEQGRLRPSLETAFLETVEPDSNGVEDLIVTTLTNDFMPLVRYRIGDLVEVTRRACHTEYTLHGRAADTFTTGAGERITTLQIDRCFEPVQGIAHYQVIERGEGQWLLRYVPDRSDPSDAQVHELCCELRHVLGTTQLNAQPVDALMPETSGKFRLGYPLSKPEPAWDGDS